ncbi:hypothetical protein [Marinicella gelatinilytica]|uniref:hypothetical protein n=1 Tax=Marinicella gelatinilytica TaxID=2996017 RepID=UPI002260DB91|nr:hypothetical protein [Marinicella gelatinilytica]MCX7544910.1 hypothetical protein [Marinicella gelatinilytica]
MKKTYVLLTLLLLTACSNVPWSTMFKLRGFDLQDFVALNPDQLKMQVISHDAVALDFKRVMMDFKLTTEDNKYEQSIDLALVSENHKQSRIIYELALTEAAKDVLRETQSFMAQHENARVGFSIKTPMPVDKNVDTMTLTINMYLSNEYLTLLDELVLDASQFQ